MSVEGCEVTINATSFSTPPVCARCEGPQEVLVKTSHYNSANRTTRYASIPHCKACDTRRLAILSKRRLLLLGAVSAGVVSAGLGAVLPSLPLQFLVAFPIAVALVAALGLRMMLGPSVETPNGAWMTGFRGQSTTFFCTNARWGEHFAHANNASAIPRKRSDAFWHLPWVLALCFTGPLAAYVAYASNPPVYVDNESKEGLQIWIDGKPSIVAAPTKGNGVRPTVRIPYGTHALGFSSVGDNKPDETVEAHVAWSGDHLFNPGRTACYWLEAAAYGSASTTGLPDGPQPLAAFYTFKKVDNWFQENPPSITTKSSGETRVSVTSINTCVELAQLGCPVPSRESFASCASHAYTANNQEAFSKCVDEAADSCGLETTKK